MGVLLKPGMRSGVQKGTGAVASGNLTQTIIEVKARGRLPSQGLQGTLDGLQLSLQQLNVAKMISLAALQVCLQVLP
mgnify:FL=1